MSVEHIHSEKFPRKPHNTPAVKVPGLVFCAGQTAGGEIKEATVSALVRHARRFTGPNPSARTCTDAQRTCLQNLKEVLELSGSSLEKVVKYNGVLTPAYSRWLHRASRHLRSLWAMY
jgi:enamine deaminase RidA (YjgF/YER057c/UK114 family)